MVPDETIIVKYLSDEASESERSMVEQWAGADPANGKMLSDLALIYDTHRTHAMIRSFDPREALRKFEWRIRRKTWKRFLQRTAVAASLMIGVAGLGTALGLWPGLRERAPSMITVNSNDNSRTQIALPDGTQVHLNSGSRITYPSRFSKDCRNVTLTGEAYFNVIHNPGQPFTVSTLDKQHNIKVLGTEFNVQAWEDSSVIQTSLISGSVEISVDGGAASAVLEPSQKAVYYPATRDLKVITADVARETDWMYGRLVFKGTPMPEVLERLTRFYNVEFDVGDDIINSYKFSGTFEDKPLYQVLEYMRIASKIDYRVTYRKEGDATESVVVLRK